MTKGRIAGGALAAGALLVVLFAGYRVVVMKQDRPATASVATAPARTPSTAAVPPATAEDDRGFLYGRVTAVDGAVFEGRLRWGGGEEAFWGDTFNGTKRGNPWAELVPPGALPVEHRPFKVFGFTLFEKARPPNLTRPFMARFGDIARVEAHGRDVNVVLKSGTVFDLDRFEASDFDDGVRVWDGQRGVVDLDSLRIATIEMIPTPVLGDAPSRLHGTVHTRQGEFAGFIQWNREKGVGTDPLDAAQGVRFDAIRSIEHRPGGGAVVTPIDGPEIVLPDTEQAGKAERGIYVDDARYGRVLISWEVFDRVDFTPGGSGPSYDAFPPGRPLGGSVTTRSGERLAGRLVFDLDESETDETLDAPFKGIDYSIPLGLVSSIAVPAPFAQGGALVDVTLASGEQLHLEPAGDLGPKNGGLLIFAGGGERPRFVRWADAARVDFDRPSATYPAVRQH